jgi:hypothetical protein
MITTDKAFERLGFTIKNQTRPNAYDHEALVTLFDYVKESKKLELQNNYLFTKLYIKLLYIFIINLEERVDINEYKHAQIKISELLQMPLETLIESITNKLNTHELDKYLQSKGVDVEKIRMLKPDEINDVYTNATKDDLKNYLMFTAGRFTSEQLSLKFKDLSIHALNKHKDFK